MVGIILNELIKLEDIILKYKLECYEPINVSIGNDENVYILFSKNRFKNEDRAYKAIKLQVEWNSGQLLSSNVLNFNQLAKGIVFIQAIGEDYLFINPRSKFYKANTFDKNALITDERGNIKLRMCLGDGINKCLVDKQNRIVTGYFDEGVLGNYGWTKPIGESGLIVWSGNGEKLWENKRHEILDCYAINVDSLDCLWFYYYTKFSVVKTDYENETEYSSPILYANEFLINNRRTSILFLNGILNEEYDSQTNDNYRGNYIANLSREGIEYCKECRLINDNNNDIEIQMSGLRGSKGVFIDKQRTLYSFELE